MAEPILNENMEKAQTGSNLSITNNDINIELGKEFLEELQKKAYHGWIDEDVMDHIAKLADDARQWWINEGEGKITVWEELVEKFYVNFIPIHTIEKKRCWTKETTGELIHLNSYRERWNKKRMDDSILSSNNTTTDSFFKPYMITRGKCDTEKEDEQSQTRRKYSNTSNSIDEQPKKRMCKAEKFEAIQYSLGPNEEYITIRRCEFDI
ncbi:hypothetical protein Tco_0509091 [Tanacetum coccineum]